MELYYALKKVVELQTEDILKDVKLINILSDFKAYDDMPSSKYLLKYMINEGLMANLLYEYQTQNDVNILLDSQTNLLSETYGYKEELADYIIKSLAFALGWTTEIPSASKTSDNSINPNSAPTPLNPQIIDDGKPHLQFRQFPITGNVNDFINTLISIGYTLSNPYSDEYNLAILNGSFASVKDCQILVVGTPKTYITCRVVVCLPGRQIWYNLKSEYLEFKEKLTKKYGKPESYEYFTEPYYEGDGYEMTALSNEHCSYSSFFKDKNGTIVVRLSQDHVNIIYEDGINSEIGENEKNSIADDEL